MGLTYSGIPQPVILILQARPIFDALASQLWPGPITIVARAAPCIPPCVTANTGFVGVRVPSHPLALALLAAAQRPIAAPSANRFGHVSPTRAAHVVADLGASPIAVLLGEGPLPGAGLGDSLTAGSGAGASIAAATTQLAPSASNGYGVAVATLDATPRDTVSSVSTCAVGIESTVAKLEEMGEGTAHGGTSTGGASVRVLVLRRGGVSAMALRAALDARGLHHVPVVFPGPQQKQPPPAGIPNGLPLVVGDSYVADPAAPLGSRRGLSAARVEESPLTVDSRAPTVIGSLAADAGDATVRGTPSSHTVNLNRVAVSAPPPSSASAPASVATHASSSPPVVTVGAEAPGMLLTHYAPDVESIFLVVPDDASSSSSSASSPASDRVPSIGDHAPALAHTPAPPLSATTASFPYHSLAALSSTVVLDLGGTLHRLAPTCLAYKDLAAGGDLAAACSAVFSALRWAECVPGAKTVMLCDPLLVPSVMAGGSWEHAEALRDRLFRAASGRTVGLSTVLAPAAAV